MRRNWLLATAVLLICVSTIQAEVRTKTVDYSFDGVNLKGHLAWDDAVQGKRPTVLVVHEWWGLNDYAKKRAEKLAALGYVALACDMYGEGKFTVHPEETGKMAGEVRKNMKTWQGRAQAALKVLQDHELVDARRVAAIGYCFGGATALELAYTGADLAAVVTFHGALPGTGNGDAASSSASLERLGGNGDAPSILGAWRPLRCPVVSLGPPRSTGHRSPPRAGGRSQNGSPRTRVRRP
jgi:dienelactone hydrolase